MKSARIAAASLLLGAMSCQIGCVLKDPVNGHTIQRGNREVHFGGWGEWGEGYIIEVKRPGTNTWEPVPGMFNQYRPVVANGLAAFLAGEQFSISDETGTLSGTLYDWRDKFNIRPALWESGAANGHRYKATARAKMVSTGGVIPHRDLDDNYRTGAITIYCDDWSLR